MTLDDIRYFETAEGRALLDEVAGSDDDELRTLMRLRNRFPPERCRAAVELTTLRSRGVTKYARASDMLFDREALEQASGETIAAHRAKRFRGFSRIADLCCGIGGDTVSLASVADVVSVDIDPVRVRMTLWNARVHGVLDRVRGVTADVSAWIPPADALFMDPSRRRDGRRLLSPADYLPPLSLPRLRAVTPNIGIKVAPGIPYDRIPADCETEFISESGACKEAVLWTGALRTEAARRATLLPSGQTLSARQTADIPVAPPGAYLYEPDRAVIRAHLVEQVAEEIDGWKLDPQVAYLTSDRPTDTPFARRFSIADSFRFSLKRLQAYLSAEGIGRLEIKKRRFPIDPDSLRPRLKLAGDRAATIVLTRIRQQPTVLVCQPDEAP